MISNVPSVRRILFVGSRIGHCVVDGYGKQCDADDGDDGSGDDRWEESQQLAEVRCHEEREEAGHDDCTVDVQQSLCAAAVGHRDCDHRRNAREGHTLKQR